jgi:hypothetical protein
VPPEGFLPRIGSWLSAALDAAGKSRDGMPASNHARMSAFISAQTLGSHWPRRGLRWQRYNAIWQTLAVLFTALCMKGLSR